MSQGSRRTEDARIELIETANRELLVDGNFESIPHFFDPSYRVHLTTRVLDGGLPTVEKTLRALQKAFDSLTVEVEILAADNERVAWMRTLRGEHVGSYAGFPATGQRITWRDQVVSAFDDERITEEWVVSDLAEQLLRARK